MRLLVSAMIVLGTTACEVNDDKSGERAPSFDGADYSTQSDKIEHGKRLANVFTCAGCHGDAYSGANFGEMIPIVKGLWATNISVTMPAMSDAQLEGLLRTGAHPSREEIYLMPSKQTQFLSKPDMDALIAYLRTVRPTGEPTPPPPPDFKKAVAARLPDDYWRWKPGQARTYHSSAEEVAYFAANKAQPVGAGAELIQGRYIALTVCSACHGAALDGRGEDAGGLEAALLYNDAEFNRLLTTSTSRNGKQLRMEWGFGHEVYPLTGSEKSAVIAYTRALAKTRAR